MVPLHLVMVSLLFNIVPFDCCFFPTSDVGTSLKQKNEEKSSNSCDLSFVILLSFWILTQVEAERKRFNGLEWIRYHSSTFLKLEKSSRWSGTIRGIGMDYVICLTNLLISCLILIHSGVTLQNITMQRRMDQLPMVVPGNSSVLFLSLCVSFFEWEPWILWLMVASL